MNIYIYIGLIFAKSLLVRVLHFDRRR